MRRVAIVAQTAADVRDVLVEGPSGFVNVAPPWFRPTWKPSKRRLTWPNGAVGITYTAEEPKRLRGPEHDGFLADEVAAWRYEDAWDQLQFGLRIGPRPRGCAITTPRPTRIVRELASSKTSAVVRGTTYDNRANLAPDFFRKIIAKYEGTRLGRQELLAEILDDNPGALWKRAQIEVCRVKMAPHLVRIVVAIDPAVTSNADSDETGIVVVGLGDDRHVYVLEDISGVYTPYQWATAAVLAYRNWSADRIVAEVNNGGDLVEVNLRTFSRDVACKKVHASRGKQARAEPVAALNERGVLHHVGMLAKLEDQLCEWDPAISSKSPDRLDALVWGVTEVAGLNQAGPSRPGRRPNLPAR
jgi:phage terminase large subunit-like protein